MAASAPSAPVAPPKLERYLAAVAITVLAVASQYFVPQNVPALYSLYASLVGDLLVVYGIPIVAFLVLVGPGPLTGWRSNFRSATVEGLRWYGMLTLLAVVLGIIAIIVLTAAGQQPENVLSKQTPVIQAALGDPWFWVVFSFPIGAFEETIFRGWIYGFWRSRPGGDGGWTAVLGTSLLFAGIHGYYAFTYGWVSIVAFLELFLLGAAFAQTVRASRGNLVIVALLHGATDATAFLSLINLDVGAGLHYGIVLFGGLIALIVWLRTQPAPFAGSS